MKQYKPLLLFLLKFCIILSVLSGSYFLYLHVFQVDINGNAVCDPYTRLVADHAVKIFNLYSDAHAESRIAEGQSYMKFMINGLYASKVNEGCNGLFINFLLIAFVGSLGNDIKKTIWFLLIGLGVMYIVNIVRIGILSYIFLYYKEWSRTMHDIIMPLISYGLLFVLCFIWLNYFALKSMK